MNGIRIHKTVVFLVIWVLMPFFTFSQGEWNNWHFGDSAAITFNTSPPTFISGSSMTCVLVDYPVSISDSNGNILFYGQAGKIYNRNNLLMPNGSGLYCHNGMQTLFAIKNPGSENLYYLFHIYNMLPTLFLGLYYSVLDMNLDGGNGDIIPGTKNTPIPDMSDAMPMLTATRHQNNKDVWLITKKFLTNQYVAFLITDSGISPVPIYSNSSIQPDTNYSNCNDEIHISLDGTLLISHHDPTVTPCPELCSFNTLTGSITPLFTIQPYLGLSPYPVSCGGFSPNSKLLYLKGVQPPPSFDVCIFQFDLSIPDSIEVINSQQPIYQCITAPGQFTLSQPFQVGPDWKLYLPSSFHDSLNAILNPNNSGIGCNFQRNVISTGGKIVYYGGLPQFLQKYKAYIHYNGHCQNQPIYFSSDIWPPPDSLHWDFGDPTSGSLNFSNDTTPSHIYNLPGQYTVELFVRHIDNRTDTSWITITIDETTSPDLGPDQTICQGDSITVDAGTCSGCTFDWSSIPPGFISTEQTVTLLQSGIYIVAVSSTNGCSGRDTIQLNVTAPPIITNSPLFKSICSGEAASIPLESNLLGTSFSWNATSSSPSIIGFGPGTGDTIDQVLTNTGPISETVTYTIIPSLGDCEGDSVEYVVTVTPGDSVLVSISASDDSICQGTQISYIATPIHGGSAPGYQWKVNRINQGTNNSVFNYTPSNDDTVCCILTSSDTVCISNNPATSNEIIMTVYPNLPVSISISTTNNPVCDGSTAMFTASTSNKGASPNFQWFVNGNPVGTNESSFSYMPSNGDQISCILTSSEQCTSNNPATSDTIVMIVNPLLPVGISISASANPICEGLPVTYTATPVNGGAMPAYQWQVNGINVGTNNPGFTYTPVDGSLVICTLTSNAECVTNNPATSNSITMSVGDAPDVSFAVCFDTITTINAKPFKLKGGVPLGGTYIGSGTGWTSETGWTFNPSIAGTGIHSVTYSYTNLFNCSNYATRAISVINPAPFSCGDSLTDIRDNKKYPTIQIESQCWLAVNLNHGQQIGGSSAQRDNCLVEKYCYNDLPANCTQYGALYQWDELMRYENSEETQGLCPPGWHVPSEADWNLLFAVYQGNAFAGSPMLYTGYSGFNVLLAGAEFFNQSNRFADFASIMWSSTSHGPSKAWSHGLNEFNYSVSYYPSYRSNAFSVRCLRD